MPEYYLLLGGAVNLPYFGENGFRIEADQSFFWTVPKAVRRGDRALIYLTAPVSAIVGEVEISAAPFENLHNMFDNDFMAGKWCAEVTLARYFARRSHLSMRYLRRHFADSWRWLKYPRASTKMSPAVREELLALIDRRDQQSAGSGNLANGCSIDEKIGIHHPV